MKAFLAILFFSSIASAYIPAADTILRKTVKNQGNRGYFVTLETRLQGHGENIAFREVWTIKDDQNMRVRVTGITPLTRGFAREYIYTDNVRYRLNQESEVVSLDLGQNHFERYFHFRDSGRMRTFLEAAQIISGKDEESGKSSEGVPEGGISSLPENTVAKDEEDSEEFDPDKEKEMTFTYTAEHFLRLGRLFGAISYTFGILPADKDAELLPSLWIEQDRFQIQKVRTSDQAIMVAKDYKSSWSLNFPKNREIQWKGNTVVISLVAIDKAIIGPKTTKALKPLSLKESTFENKYEMADTLNTSIINEFYQRFR